jgi:transposase
VLYAELAGLDRQSAHRAALPAPVPPPRPRTTPRATHPGQDHSTASHLVDHDQPEHLSAGDQVWLKQILARCPQLEATAGHVASFAAMMGQRTGKEQLPAWLDAVTADDLPALHSLVVGLRRDLDAVTNGLSLDYSSGQVEGSVNRIKMIKRQMFGRAKFDLLRKRILLAH